MLPPRAALTRRSLLHAGAGLLLGLGARSGAAPLMGLPTVADLDTERLLTITGLGRRADVTPLGSSAQGRRIDMLSVGMGNRSALIVGAPHPNEPIGCLTIVRLLARLARDGALREEAGWRWHFIPAIDLDGLALNEGWFRGPLTPARYCQYFYRPPFALQPEYAFPLTVDRYAFDAATPENSCWQKALAVARPQLQCSLHGADSGGTFFICSDSRPALFDALLGLASQYHLPVNPVGEPFSDMAAYRPGIVAFPAVETLLRQASDAGRDPAEAWDAGDSSAGFAARTGGTFSLACEVPLWDDRRLHDLRPSPFSTVDTLRAQARQAGQDHALLDSAEALLDAPDLDPAQLALAASLREARHSSANQPLQLRQLAAMQDARQRLSWAELVQYEPGTAGWRTPAMLTRLARLRGVSAIAAAADRLLQERLRALDVAHLRPVPLSVSSGLQLASIAAAVQAPAR